MEKQTRKFRTTGLILKINYMNNVKSIYSLRQSFSIIALTGRMAGGCSVIAERLSLTKEQFLSDVDIKYRNKTSLTLDPTHFQNNLFIRKYSIVQNYVNVNWKKYQIIDYKKVLLLYLINEIKLDLNPIQSLSEIIKGLFVRGINDTDKDLEGDFEIDQEILSKIIADNNFLDIIEKLKLFGDIFKTKSIPELAVLNEIFYGSDFNNLFSSIEDLLNKINYYLKVFLFHKLSHRIRAFGSYKEYPETAIKTENVYNVAKLIHKLIKAYKYAKGNDNNCHIVIDSLKNSLEVMFFKERYSAFYMLSIHNDAGYEHRIKEKIKHTEAREITVEKVMDLDKTEYDSSSFSAGKFYAPDVQNCIQKSEVHIQFNDDLTSIPGHHQNSFYTLTEQLMKLQALIQQPGIITPTAVERCMQIAYNSKFNSGCISRQVGAVITDDGFSIKSVGWNDVPQNNIACLFRNAAEVIQGKKDMAYSDFEDKENEFGYSKNVVVGISVESEKPVTTITNSNYVGKNFATNLEQTIGSSIEIVESEGKNCSFCFKNLHNTFEGEKNQVHTRSLHAEENAMLQISKHGGQKLKDGILFTTASPCELCAKKAYQIGIKQIYFIDEYPGISKMHVLGSGLGKPQLNEFIGIIGSAFNKLYEPLMAYKDELSLYAKEG